MSLVAARLRTAAVLFALVACACSSTDDARRNEQTGADAGNNIDGGQLDGGGTEPDGGSTIEPPDPAYWGLADKACFHFDDGSKADLFTLSVLKDTVTTAGRTTYRLSFRSNGFIQLREEFVEVLGDALVLWRRTQPGDPLATPPVPNAYFVFNSAPVYLPKQLTPQQPEVSEAQVRISEGGVTSTVNYSITAVKEASETLQVLGEPQTASKVLLNSWREDTGVVTTDRIWLVPNLGFAKYQLSGMNAPVVLTEVEQNIDPVNCVPK